MDKQLSFMIRGANPSGVIQLWSGTPHTFASQSIASYYYQVAIIGMSNHLIQLRRNNDNLLAQRPLVVLGDKGNKPDLLKRC